MEQTNSPGQQGSLVFSKMDWLAKSAKRRCSPSQLMVMPKSVIVCAMEYEKMPPSMSLRGSNSDRSNLPNATKLGGLPRPFGARNDRLPKYLQHEDYHTVMMEKLEALTAEIKKDHPDAKFKCYADTGPVLEKTWGALAGLGFIGKNTLLIVPGVGSQVALGVIVTDVDLPQGETARIFEGCADCDKCIKACPHGALVAPYVLDSRKCISYKYFIEKREGGCDICQDVCPFNKLIS